MPPTCASTPNSRPCWQTSCSSCCWGNPMMLLLLLPTISHPSPLGWPAQRPTCRVQWQAHIPTVDPIPKSSIWQRLPPHFTELRCKILLTVANLTKTAYSENGFFTHTHIPKWAKTVDPTPKSSIWQWLPLYFTEQMEMQDLVDCGKSHQNIIFRKWIFHTHTPKRAKTIKVVMCRIGSRSSEPANQNGPRKTEVNEIYQSFGGHELDARLLGWGQHNTNSVAVRRVPLASQRCWQYNEAFMCKERKMLKMLMLCCSMMYAIMSQYHMESYRWFIMVRLLARIWVL